MNEILSINNSTLTLISEETPELILKEIAQNGTGKRNLFALSVLSNVKKRNN